MRIVITLVVVLLLFLGGIAYIVLSTPEAGEQTIADAEAALANQDFESALALANRYLEKFPDSHRGLIVAGTAHERFNELDKAYEYFQQAIGEDNPGQIGVRLVCGRLSRSLGRVVECEQHLRAVLEEDPNHAEASAALFHLLRLEGRNSELRPLFMITIRRRHFSLDELLVMARPEVVHLVEKDGEFVQGCMKVVPDDPLPMMGQARSMMEADNSTDALPILIDVARKHRHILTAQGLLGELLVRVGTQEQLRDWLNQLPENWRDEPGVWFAIGELADRGGDLQGAARCFWEALRLDPIHRRAAYRLGQTLARLGQTEDALQFQDHARELSDLASAAFEAGPNAPEKMREVYEGMKKLGRIWEAAGWCFAAMQLEDQTWVTDAARDVLTQIEAGPPFVLASANPASEIDLSEWPPPDISQLNPIPNDGAPSGSPTPPPEIVTFRNDAQEKGIDFTFFTDVSTQARIFEFSGGGASVIDFDLDGWPDVYLTEGAKWPVDPAQNSLLDRLYRNTGDQFEHVTESAQLSENGYSQGAAIGDFNNDGFPDIFVGNIGPNRLFQNNGDGTFTSIDLGDLAGNDWTISSLVADLNGDGNPDIYAANYLSGDELFTRECLLGAKRIQCSPGYFPAAEDRLLVGDGSGGWRDRTREDGILTSEGKGMGVVTFRLSDQQTQSVLVSNDTTPNYLFTNRSGEVDFEEHGMLTGLALGADGRAQSCMGIAAGDANNDGALDFFITNFSQELNNLYLQQQGGYFEDRIAASGLRDAGYQTMGWGAQFLDANLDGHLDLLVANGHLEERGPKPPSQMATQYFHNEGKGRFVLANRRATGKYFEKDYFGRAIARLDWNRDGLPDAVVTHRTAPVALLTNTTSEHGDSVRITLVGTNTARDAVGAVLRLKTSAGTLTHQVIAGDGFQASNQKQVVFGVASGETIESLTVSWPAGTQTELTSVPVNSDLTLIEGRSAAMAIPQ